MVDESNYSSVGVPRDAKNVLQIKLNSSKKWDAHLMHSKKKVEVGSFDTLDDAILARDMDVFRIFGMNFTHLLNNSYKVKLNECSNLLSILACNGNEFLIDINATDAAINDPPVRQLQPQKMEMYTVQMQAPILPFPSLHPRQPPQERVCQSHLPTTSYAFDMTFSHTQPMGLNLKQQIIAFSCGSGYRSFGCLVVSDVSSHLLEPYVSIGDIIIRVNEKPLLSTLENPGVFSFEASTKAITSAQYPRTLRFARGPKNGNIVSLAELLSFLGMTDQNQMIPLGNIDAPFSQTDIDNAINTTKKTFEQTEDAKVSAGDAASVVTLVASSPAVAKLNPNPPPSPDAHRGIVAKFNVTIPTGVHMLYVDPMTPPAIKKQLQGGTIAAWQSAPENSVSSCTGSNLGKRKLVSTLLKAQTILANTHAVSGASTSNAQSTSQSNNDKIVQYLGRGGVFPSSLLSTSAASAAKGPGLPNTTSWTVVIEGGETALDPSIYVGRYDKEDDAYSAFIKAKADMVESGCWEYSKRYIPSLAKSQSVGSQGGGQGSSHSMVPSSHAGGPSVVPMAHAPQAMGAVSRLPSTQTVPNNINNMTPYHNNLLASIPRAAPGYSSVPMAAANAAAVPTVPYLAPNITMLQQQQQQQQQLTPQYLRLSASSGNLAAAAGKNGTKVGISATQPNIITTAGGINVVQPNGTIHVTQPNVVAPRTQPPQVNHLQQPHQS